MSYPNYFVELTAGITLNSRMHAYLDDVSTDDGDVVALGSNNFPAVDILHDGDSTPAVTWHAHGHVTIGAGLGTTIDFGTTNDARGVLIGNGATVMEFVCVIVNPNSTDFLRIGPNSVANAVSFNIGAATTTYQDFYHNFPYLDPVKGSAGNKVVIKNPGANPIECAWAMAGHR